METYVCYISVISVPGYLTTLLFPLSERDFKNTYSLHDLVNLGGL